MMFTPEPATRPAAVAGLFYPAPPAELRRQVDEMLADAQAAPAPPPKALIAPHAGYVYSGPIAASAYAQLASGAQRIGRVVLLGPAHRAFVRGLALPGARRFATPLGEVDIDQQAVAALRDLPQVVESPPAHQAEHALEVQLPFLQRLLGRFTLLPLAVGEASADEVAEVLDRLWGGDETLVVVSSDLSHYLPYDAARRTDRHTVDHLLSLDAHLSHEQACGATPINGLLRVARRRGLRAELLDLRNSGDTAGDRYRVVGYAAVAFRPVAASGAGELAGQADAQDRGSALLAHARSAIAAALERFAPPAPELAFLRDPGATFVTLRKRGELCGCIGSLAPRRPLREDVRANAAAAAFDDPRFPPLTADEYEAVDIEVSVLSAATPMAVASESDLHAQLCAGTDGLILELGSRRSTFLPQVWDALPRPREFVDELKRKAGLPRGFWSEELRFSRYTVEKFAERSA
jgi:AmmeMemoRadiSam system protein B/AmmeMemoRadiSam system protein A